jgi:hypothetical protein
MVVRNRYTLRKVPSRPAIARDRVTSFNLSFVEMIIHHFVIVDTRNWLKRA